MYVTRLFQPFLPTFLISLSYSFFDYVVCWLLDWLVGGRSAVQFHFHAPIAALSYLELLSPSFLPSIIIPLLYTFIPFFPLSFLHSIPFKEGCFSIAKGAISRLFSIPYWCKQLIVESRCSKHKKVQSYFFTFARQY